MAGEPMSLAQNYKAGKTPFPAVAQIKYDGVPITFKSIGGHIVPLTRQNEVCKSVDHIKDILREILEPGDEVTMECLVKGEVDFKTISGVVRRHTTDKRIFGKIFDGARAKQHDMPYYDRYRWFGDVVNKAYRMIGTGGHKPVQQALGAVVNTELEMYEWYSRQLHYYNKAAEQYPDLGIRLEGIMLHDIHRPYTPGKRIWGMSRYKPQPTIDLRVVGYEEALSKTGVPLGMVGRINVELNRRQSTGEVVRSVVGIGPGKLTHKEREALWRGYMAEDASLSGIGAIACIQYMPDPSYDALRQPTFQFWHKDKTEQDTLEY